MRSNLLILLAVLFLFSGCCQTENPEPEQKLLLQRKLSNISYPGGSTVFDLTYTYNDQDQLVRVGGNSIRNDDVIPVDVTVAYDSKGRVIHVKKAHSHEWTYTYNDKDQLVNQVRLYIDEDPSKSTKFSYQYNYNASNQLEKVKVYKWQNNSDTHVSTYNYAYTAGNRITISAISPTGVLTRKQDIVTDDKKLPAYVLPLYSIPIFYFAEVFAEGIFTDHNITSLTMLNGVEQTLYSGSYQAQYTYNKDGYPATCTKNFVGNTVEQIEYIYKKK